MRFYDHGVPSSLETHDIISVGGEDLLLSHWSVCINIFLLDGAVYCVIIDVTDGYASKVYTCTCILGGKAVAIQL